MSTPSYNVVCLATVCMRMNLCHLDENAEIRDLGYSKTSVVSDIIQNIWQINLVRCVLKFDAWLLTKVVAILSNTFNFGLFMKS